jgi:hypothetical protein
MATPIDHTGDISLKRTHPENDTDNNHDTKTNNEDSHSNSSEQSGSGDESDDAEGAAETDRTEPDSDESDEAEIDDAEDDDEPWRPYSSQELASFFLEFYTFLATLHYDPSDLKLPPPEGWDITLFPSELINKKSDLVVDLMRHLPYFKAGNPESTHVHYKSILIDYTHPEEHMQAIEYDDMLAEEEIWSDEGLVDHADLLVLAQGYESFGRTFILDVRTGVITEDMIRANLLSPVDVQELFDKLKIEYRSLKLMPCAGREIKEADDVPERDGSIDAEDVRKQEEPWGTDLDWQFVRQIYREHGWPEQFRREEAFQTVEDFMEMDVERRDDWETQHR